MPIWTGQGANNNWSTAANWDTGVPTAAQPAIFDGVTGLNPNKNVTITAGATCASITFVGYTGQANFANNLTVVGNITFGTGMSFDPAGVANLVCTGNGGVLTSNGKVFPGGLTLQHGSFSWVTNLADNWTIGGSFAQAGPNTPRLSGSGGVRTLNVGNSIMGGGMSLQNITIVMNGTGSLSGGGGFTNVAGGTSRFIINTAGVITHSSTFTISGFPFEYQAGTFNSTGTLRVFGGTSLVNVSSITFGNIDFSNNFGGQTITILSDVNIAGNLTGTGNAGGNINGLFTVFVEGNIDAITQTFGGTSTIEMVGSSNATIRAGTIRNSLTINKSGGSTVSFLSSFNWGENGRTLQRLAGNINPGATTVTINTANTFGTFTVNGMTFNNLTLGLATTMIQNASNTIQSTLACSSATFQGTHGFITNNFTCTTAASTITLQNINANPLAEYRITGSLNIIGTLANRIVLQAAGRVSFTGGIASAVFPATTSIMTTTGGPALLAGMTVSQATGQAPTGLSNLFPNRPTITSGSVNTWNLNSNVNPSVIAGTSLAAGFKARFILEEGALQNVIYVRTEDIDSSDGQTIFSFGSNQDNVSSNVSLFRTLNWGPLIAPTGSIAHTFVN